jgi:hypothetical protein
MDIIMRLLLFIVSASFSVTVFAMSASESAFPGYGFSWYGPVCGYACNAALANAMLSCTEMDHSMDHMGMSMGMTTPECRASDTSFLTTLAYCMNTTCDIPIWKREKFWANQATGDETVPPKWTYEQALAEIKGKPTVVFNQSSEDVLDGTQIVNQETYGIQARFMVMFDYIEMLQARYM